MCGRFTLYISTEIIQDYFGIHSQLDITPHYNIAPSQKILVVRQPNNDSRNFAFLRWGLIPAWKKEETITSQWINARAESIDEKPLFRQAFKQRRCLIVADGFYEWQVKAKQKQPFFIYKKDHSPLAFAGVWEHWKNPQGDIIESCAIITTDANSLLKPIHNRMPVIIDPINFTNWLNPQYQAIENLKSLLKPFPSKLVNAHPVGLKVNKPIYDTPDCIAPIK